MARCTGEKFSALDVAAVDALPDSELKTMFECDTSMRYENLPSAQNDQEKCRIIKQQLMGYLMAACPQQLETYNNR